MLEDPQVALFESQRADSKMENSHTPMKVDRHSDPSFAASTKYVW